MDHVLRVDAVTELPGHAAACEGGKPVRIAPEENAGRFLIAGAPPRQQVRGHFFRHRCRLPHTGLDRVARLSSLIDTEPRFYRALATQHNRLETTLPAGGALKNRREATSNRTAKIILPGRLTQPRIVS